MPDMQTALNKVLNSWNQPQPEVKPVNTTQPNKYAHLIKFEPTTNVTRTTFNHIKQHPGITGGEVSRALVAQGFKQSSTSSVITQLLAHGQIRRDADRKLHAIVNEYVPMKKSARVNAVKAPKPAKVKKVKEVKAPKPAALQIKPATDVGVMLSTMSITQARALYDELKKIFGG